MLGPSTGSLRSLAAARSNRSSESICTFETAEEPSKGDETGLVKHADLWFIDGSVVLRAEDTIYRVHISQLSRHSIFFRDLFALPQGCPTDTSHDDNDDNVLEGCPLVYLHDTAEDVSNLLTALYDGPNFGNNSQTDFRVVSGILRLSTKYLCDSLRAKALAHLKLAWPADLKTWDAREDMAREMDVNNMAEGHVFPSPIAVINLAREINAPSLLPSAFYDLSRYSYAQIFESSDGETVLSMANQTLTISDMQRFCMGKEASQQAITSMIRAMGSSQNYQPSHHHSTSLVTQSAHVRRYCLSAAACRKDFGELMDLATQHYIFDRERGHGDPLYVAEELGQLKGAEFSGSECKACAKSLEMWAGKERDKIWRSIPGWFRLGLVD